MKKILMGLAALSATTFAVGVNLGDLQSFTAATAGGVSIPVKGTVTSEVKAVKYVIYASSDNGATMETTLKLPEFVLSATGGGFVENPTVKVYVKQLSEDGQSAIEPTATVAFGVEFDPFYTNVSGGGVQNFTSLNGKGGSASVRATALIAKDKWNELITGNAVLNGENGVEIDSRGVLKLKQSTSGYYAGAKRMQLNCLENGVLSFTAIDETVAPEVTEEIKSAVSQVLAGGVVTSPNLAIKVKITE